MNQDQEEGSPGSGGIVGKFALIAFPFLLLLVLFLLDHFLGGRR